MGSLFNTGSNISLDSVMKMPNKSLGQNLNLKPSPGKSETVNAAKYMMPKMGKVKRDYEQYQGNIIGNRLQGQAIGEQQSLRGNLRDELGNYRSSSEARLAEGFDTAGTKAADALSARGVPAGALEDTVRPGIARELGLARGKLNDQILDKTMNMEQSTSDTVSELLFGSSEQATNMYGHILGSGGIGNFGAAVSMDPNVNRWVGVNLPGDGEPRQPNEPSQPGGPDGGGASGTGGSTSNDSYSGPQVYDNPYYQPPDSAPADKTGYDPATDGAPRAKGDPVFHPEEYLEFLEETRQWKEYRAELSQRIRAATVAMKSAGQELAGGPGDALGGGLNTTLGGGLA